MRWAGRRLRFTREGKYFVALTLGIGFAAINTGNNLLYLVLGTMLALIVGSGVLSELTLRRLRVERHRPERIFAERPFLLGLTLSNDKRRIPSFSVEVEDVLSDQPLERKCYFLKVPAGKAQLASYRHSFAARGMYELQEVRLKTRFPFALFEKSRGVPLRTSLVVYPQIHPISADRARTPGDGEDHRGRPGRRGEFFGLRDYRDGDNPRDVFWRKSARVGRMLVREHEDPRGRRVTVFLDNRRLSAVHGKERAQREEQAVSQAASLAVHHLNRGCSVALVSHSAEVRSASGPGQLDRILKALALIAFVETHDDAAPPQLPSGHIHVSPAQPVASGSGRAV